MARKAQEASLRANRFPVQIPVRFRALHGSEWFEAQTENVSHTGVLFQTNYILKPKTLLEVRLELPPTKRNGTHAQVVCKGEVVRIEQTRCGEISPALAVAIHDYRLTRNGQPN